MCAYWLFKSEPSVFSIQDLEKAPQKTTYWSGVRNYQARNFIRDTMKKGDKVFFYHSNTEPNVIVGLAEIVKEAYPDFTAFDPDSEGFDPKSKTENPAWYMVDIRFLEIFPNPLPLDELKQNADLKDFRLLQRGNRLSVFPVTDGEAKVLLRLSKGHH